MGSFGCTCNVPVVFNGWKVTMFEALLFESLCLRSLHSQLCLQNGAIHLPAHMWQAFDFETPDGVCHRVNQGNLQKPLPRAHQVLHTWSQNPIFHLTRR